MWFFTFAHMLNVQVPEYVLPTVNGKAGTISCAIMPTGAVCKATSVPPAPLSLVVLLRLVAQAGALPPEVPAVVQRWILLFASAIRLPTTYACVDCQAGLVVPIAAGSVAAPANRPSSLIVIPLAP